MSKAKSKSDQAIRKPLVLGELPDDPVDMPLIEEGPLAAAFGALTGHRRDGTPDPIVQKAFKVFTWAVVSAIHPSPRMTKWLSRVPVLEVYEDERRLAVLKIVQSRLNCTVTIAGVEHGPLVRELCEEIDPKFANLSDESQSAALQHLRSERQIPKVSALLSLACGAFGDRRQQSESQESALRRVSALYRSAKSRRERGKTRR